ncbi:MAG: ABC transporter permease [Spiroplasma endosymbiont of Drosophila atripex]|nr:MAG: ABC transporter permease [Spiroplasma endosymbiont of Drosophila atripex]
MVKIFFNYLREQRKNIIQVLGLGFLVMIMIITFLSIQFSDQYVENQYLNDISQNTNFQELNELPIEKNSFEKEYNYYKTHLGLWLENMSYYKQDDSIDTFKLNHATFQIALVNANTDTYRFIFNGSSDLSDSHANNYLQIGNNISTKYHHHYVDFKLLVPNDYHQGYNSSEEYKNSMRNLINSYVYDGKTNINQVNYFILNDKALKIYQDEIYHKISYANHEYNTIDISLQSQLYFLIINGMLFQNIEWNQYTLVNYLLMTGKSFLFTQTVPKNIIDPPILVGNYKQSLEELPLQDNEILIYEQFANNNNLKIGDKYNIVNRTFTVRGFVTSRNSAFIANNISGLMDPKNKTVAFVNSNTMVNINNDFKGFIDKNKQKNSFNPVYPERSLNPWLYNILHNQLAYGHHYQNLTNGINFANVASILKNDDYLWRPYNENAIFFLNERINLTQNVGIIFLTLIFTVTSVIILMVVWKMIHHNHKLIGILKALGYKNWQLTISLVLAIIWPLFIFAIIGVLISVFISHILINSHNLYLALINYGWYINVHMTIIVVTVPLLLLVIISFFIVYLFLQKNHLT